MGVAVIPVVVGSVTGPVVLVLVVSLLDEMNEPSGKPIVIHNDLAEMVNDNNFHDPDTAMKVVSAIGVMNISVGSDKPISPVFNDCVPEVSVNDSGSSGKNHCPLVKADEKCAPEVTVGSGTFIAIEASSHYAALNVKAIGKDASLGLPS